PVIRKADLDAPHYAGREPGLTTGIPARHCGHSSGRYTATCKVASATRGTPTSACPPLRSIMEPAPITSAPAARSTSTTSCVLPHGWGVAAPARIADTRRYVGRWSAGNVLGGTPLSRGKAPGSARLAVSQTPTIPLKLNIPSSTLEVRPMYEIRSSVARLCVA